MGLSAATGRLKAEFLHKNLVIIQGHDKGVSRGQKNDDGSEGTYTWVRGTIAVIDGPISDELESMLPEGTSLPAVLEDVRIQEAAITRELEGKVGKYDEDGTPKLVVGRVGKYTNTKGGTSYKLAEGTSASDFELAVKYVAKNGDVFPEKDPFEDEAKAAKAFA